MILIVSLEGDQGCLNFYQSSHKVQIKARELLAGLDKLLKKEKTSPKGVSGILVFFGNLSFSASRQAAAVLNTLAFVQKIKIAAFHPAPQKATGVNPLRNSEKFPKGYNTDAMALQSWCGVHGCPNKQTIEKGLKILAGRKIGDYIEPRYDRPPNITQPKKLTN